MLRAKQRRLPVPCEINPRTKAGKDGNKYEASGIQRPVSPSS
jgi:hypothetical protein